MQFQQQCGAYVLSSKQARTEACHKIISKESKQHSENVLQIIFNEQNERIQIPKASETKKNA